jgi:hypothetical protein
MCYALLGIDIILRLLLVEKKVAARWAPDTADHVSAAAVDTSRQSDDGRNFGRDESKETFASRQSASDPEKATTDLTGTPPLEASQPPPESTDNRGSRLRDRLPPVLSLLYSRRLLSALFAAIIQAALLTAFDGVLAIHAARIFGWGSTGAALLFLPIVIPSFLAPLAGMLSDRIGGRYPAALGFLLATIPLVFLRFVEENTLKDKVLLCAMLALVGLTLSFTFPPLMAEISGVVETKEKKMLASGKKGYGKGGAYAQAYALFNMAFAAGSMIGPLAAGAVVQDRGWATMAWILGLLSGITSIPTFLWLGGWVFRKS